MIFRVICKLNHTRPASYKGANGLGLSTILALPSTIVSCFEDFFKFFFGGSGIINNSYYLRGAFYLVLFIAALCSLILIFKNTKKERVSKIISSSLLILIFPVAVNVMNVIATGTRINLVTGPGILTSVVLFLLLISYLKEETLANLLKYVSYITVSIIALTFVISNMHTYVAREKQYNDFKVIAENVYTRATMLEEYEPGMEFMFSDVVYTKAPEFEKTNGMVTNNTISWTGYAGVKRYQMFYKKFLGIDITSADEVAYKRIVNTDDFKKMEVYPKAGSVKIIDNVVVVKVSEKTFIKEDGEVKLW